MRIHIKLFILLVVVITVQVFWFNTPVILAESYQEVWEQVPIKTKAQQTAGLFGGEGMQGQFSMSYAASDPRIVYFTTDVSPCWKSNDGGFSWQPKHKGLGAEGAYGLAVSPADPDFVFLAGSTMELETKNSDAAQGIYRTIDGGENWELVRSTTYNRPGASNEGGKNFAFDADTVYAVTETEGILVSTQRGEINTWQRLILKDVSGRIILVGAVGFSDIKIHPLNPKVLYVSSVGLGLWKIEITGTAIAIATKIGAGLGAFPGSVVINPQEPKIMYAAAGDRGVYKSIDGGVTFKAVTNGLPPYYGKDDPRNRVVSCLDISPVNPKNLYVSYDKAKFFYSNNGGDSWSEPEMMDVKNLDGWVSGSIDSALRDTITINGVEVAASRGGWTGGPVAAHPSDPNVALMTGYANHIKKTSDAGKNWAYSSDRYSGGRTVGNTVASAAEPIAWTADPNVFAIFLTDFGAYLTEDGGGTFRHLGVPRWQSPNAVPQTTKAQTTWAGAIKPDDHNTIVTASGHWGGDSGAQSIYVTHDGGKNWKGGEVAKEDVYHFIAFHPTKPNIVYAQNWKSMDGGYTWKGVREIIGMHPTNGDIVYSSKNITLADGTAAWRFFKSIDGGATWTQPFADVAGNERNVGQVAFDPENPDKLYVAVVNKGIYVIEGKNKRLIAPTATNGLSKDMFGQFSIHQLVVDPKHGNIIYAGMWNATKGSANGIFRSTDGGQTWVDITGSLELPISIWSVSVSPHDGYVYVGTSQGTWKLPPPYAPKPPTATTGVSSNVTSGSAMVSGIVNPKGLATEVYFQYGTVSGEYSDFTANQTKSDFGDIEISANLKGLLASTTYYYRVAAKNIAGTAYGDEMSFVTAKPLDTSAPVGLISISGGAVTTKSSAVNLSLSATDDIEIAGYYLSETKNIPVASASGWVLINNPPRSYNTIVAYTLSPGDGKKIVYCWYKDATGNISETASVSIVLDTVPVAATKTISASKALTAPKIDGNLNDSAWSVSANINKVLAGSSNNTAAFGVAWDANYLYVGVKVLDSILKNDSTNAWCDDSIEIYIDANHNHSITYDAYDRQFIKGYNDAVLFSKQNKTGVLHGWSAIPGGYSIEVAIPWSNLGITPAAGMAIGFDIQQNDDDAGGDIQNALGWSNDGITTNNFKNTAGFGHLVLS